MVRSLGLSIKLFICCFLFDGKISGDEKSSYQKLSFAMYFLGMFNLMFNWGHHIYLFPTEKYIHYIAYAVSMTEWIILIRIFTNGPTNQKENKQFYYFSLSLLMASDYWVTLKLNPRVIHVNSSHQLIHARNAYHGGTCHGNYYRYQYDDYFGWCFLLY